VGEIDGLPIYQDKLVKLFLPEEIEIGMKGFWPFKKLAITNIYKFATKLTCQS